MQCKAEFRILDQYGKNIITFYCTDYEGHKGDHIHEIVWEKEIAKMIVTVSSDS